MTPMNLSSPAARRRAADMRSDRSVALILFLIFGLVFAPVVGLHVAWAGVGPGIPQAETTITAAADEARPRP